MENPITDSEKDSAGASQSLDCSETVYRIISTDYWVKKKTGRITRHAFFRRPTDMKGVSVDITSRLTLEACIENSTTNKCFAVATLHIGRTRDLNLKEEYASLDIEVIPDAEISTHAHITGIPYKDQPEHTDEDIKRLNDLADDLASQCYPAWYSDEIREKQKLGDIELNKPFHA